MERLEVQDGVFIRMTYEEGVSHCKMGRGEATCMYLTMGPEGFGCCRATSFADAIDKTSESGLMKSKGLGNWPGCYWEDQNPQGFISNRPAPDRR